MIVVDVVRNVGTIRDHHGAALMGSTWRGGSNDPDVVPSVPGPDDVDRPEAWSTACAGVQAALS